MALMANRKFLPTVIYVPNCENFHPENCVCTTILNAPYLLPENMHLNTWKQFKLREVTARLWFMKVLTIKSPEYVRGGLGTFPEKNGKMWEFFPSGGPPLPPVWEPHVCEKKLRFILHFRTLGTFLVFTKISLFGGIMACRSGNGWPPPSPSSEKFPLYPVLLNFFTEWALGDPKQN